MASRTWSYLMAGAALNVFVTQPVHAVQAEEIRLVGYESVDYRRLDGREKLHIVGPILEQGATQLRADDAIDEGDGTYQFRGNVVIIEEGDTLKAEYVLYHDDTKIGQAEGNVRLSDGSVEVLAPFGTYFVDEKRATFDRSVTFADSLSVLTASRGVYYTEEERGRFAGDVLLLQEDTIVHADSMVHDRPEDVFEALGQVVFRRVNASDSTGSTLLADRLIHFGTADSTYAEGSVMLMQHDVADPGSRFTGDEVFAVPDDATFLFASRVAMLAGEDRTRMMAQDSVMVSDPDFAVRSDSLVTSQGAGKLEESRFFGQPMAWLDETQLSADSLFSRGRASRIDSILGFGNVFVASRDSASGRIQQLRGRRLVAHLRQDTLQHLEVTSNAEAIFYTREKNSDRTSAVSASSDSVRFYFVAGELDRIGFHGQVQGHQYSENLFDQLQDLQGYIWLPDRRPDREQIRSAFRAAVTIRRRRTQVSTEVQSEWPAHGDS